MATTENGIYYPGNYEEIADVPEDMKKQADSIDVLIAKLIKEDASYEERLLQIKQIQQRFDYDMENIHTTIGNILEKDIEQNKIIGDLQARLQEENNENQRIKEDMNNTIPTVPGSGEEISLKGTTKARFKKFEISGNSYQEKDDTKPSIENPSEVKSCGDNGNVNFSVKNKNWLDLSHVQKITKHGVTCTCDPDNQTVTFNGTSETENNVFIIEHPQIEKGVIAKKGKTTLTAYYISGSVTEEKENDVKLRVYTSNYSAGINMYLGELGVNNKKVSNTYSNYTEDVYLNAWSFRFEKGDQFNNFTIKAMLTDKVDMDYFPHQSQQISIPTQKPFRKINDYKDTFIKQNDKWYEAHFITEVIVDESEKVVDPGAINENNTLACVVAQNTGVSEFSLGYCTHFKTNLRGQFYSTDAIGYNFERNTARIRVPKSEYEDYDAVQNMLKQQYENGTPLKFYGILKEPKLIECTEEQTAILDKIENELYSYKDVTHIQSKDDVSPIFDIEAFIDLQSEHEYLQSQIDEIKELLSATKTSAMLVENYEKDLEREVM